MSTMTLPPSSSRAGSFRSTTTAGSTITPVQRATPSHNPPHANTLSRKLRHLFDHTSTATFVASVTVHELTNVPQVNGEFAVRWKFRGSRPMDAEKALSHATPRLTEREANLSSRGTPNSSVPSLIRPTDTGSIRSNANSSSSLARTVRHSSSLPLPHSSIRREYQPSEPPTPERRPAVLVEEPASFDDSASSIAPATPASQTTSQTPFTPATPTESSSPSSSRGHSMYSDAGSSDVRLNPGAPASLRARRPSLNESLRGSGPGAGPRVESRTSIRSDFSADPSMSTLSTSPVTSTARSAISSLASGYDSKDRKGLVPPSPVKSHTVEWDYSVQHVLRIPLGKPVPVNDVPPSRLPASQKESRRSTLPVLGHGPESDSSLRLEVVQVSRSDLSRLDKLEGKEGPVLGYVNIDLAPFADQGPTARRYLLLNSRTNATLRVSVDMRCIGGNRDWVTPPFAEGHLAGIHDLTGTEDSLPELQLMPTRSVSSTSSDKSCGSRPSFRSTKSTISLNHQHVNQVTNMTKHRYHSYEYHLRPEHRVHRHHKHPERAHTLPETAHDVDDVVSPTSPIVADAQTSSPLQVPTLQPPALSPVVGPASDTSTSSPSAVSSNLVSDTHPAPAHGDYFPPLSPRYTSTVSDVDSLGLSMHKSPPTPFVRTTSPIMEYETLQPDLVIESVFNPTKGEEIGPFTYTEDPYESYDDASFAGEEYAPSSYDAGAGGAYGGVYGQGAGEEDKHAHAQACWRKIRNKIHHHERPFAA